MRGLLVALFMAPVLAAAAPSRLEMQASELIGTDVINASGETIGELKDLIFDARDGEIRSAVIEYGGWLGVGERAVALPAGPLTQRGNSLVFDVTEEALRNAPNFERAIWPATRASALIDREVHDRLHRDAGEIKDLLVDLVTGRVHYALVDRRDDWKPGRDLVAVPIENFSLPRDMGRFAVLNVTRENMGAGR